VDECKPLPEAYLGALGDHMAEAQHQQQGGEVGDEVQHSEHTVDVPPQLRGLHSSTFQLNLSALYGIGGARRGCVARVEGVLGRPDLMFRS